MMMIKKIEKAQDILEKEYEIATKLEHVRDPLVWALHETWRIFDQANKEAALEEE